MLVAVALAVGAVVAGILFSRFVLPHITRRMTKTPGRGEAVILRAAGRMPVIWFLVAGVYAAVRTIPVSPGIVQVIEERLVVILTNYYLPAREMAVRVQVGVSYESDLEKVERVTIEAAREAVHAVEGGVETYDPGVYYHTFDDFSINFVVVMRVSEFLASYHLKHEFVKRLHRRYSEEGIEIPFPIRTVHMRQPGDVPQPPPGGDGE